MGDSMFYCCATNYHKSLGLRQHIYYLPVSLGQQSRHCLPESSAQGLTGIKLPARLCFILELWGALESSHSCLQNSAPWSYRREARLSFWLSAGVTLSSRKLPTNGFHMTPAPQTCQLTSSKSARDALAPVC